jgi:hypothetical protein
MARITSFLLCCGAIMAFSAIAQQSTDENAPPDQVKVDKHKKKHPGATKDIAGGAGNVGTGAAKGAGDAAKGAGKGAADLATLHPVDAAGSVGKGAAETGKDVTVGAAKGGGKVVRGVGKVFKKIL